MIIWHGFLAAGLRAAHAHATIFGTGERGGGIWNDASPKQHQRQQTKLKQNNERYCEHVERLSCMAAWRSFIQKSKLTAGVTAGGRGRRGGEMPSIRFGGKGQGAGGVAKPLHASDRCPKNQKKQTVGGTSYEFQSVVSETEGPMNNIIMYCVHGLATWGLFTTWFFF